MTPVRRPGRRASRLTSAVLAALTAIGFQAAPAAAAILQAQITATFGTPTIPLGFTTALSFAIHNPNPTITTLGSVAFSDSMPAGLAVQSGPTTNDCSGATGSTSSSVSLSGGVLGPGATCHVLGTIVQGTTAGSKDDPVTVTSSAGTGNTSTPNIVVVAPPAETASLRGSTLLPIDYTSPNVAVYLQVSLHNPNTASALTGIGFSSTLPSNLVVANPNGLTASGGCSAGEVTAGAGSHAISLAGVTLAASSGDPNNPAAGEMCVVDVKVVTAIEGDYFFSTGPVANNESTVGQAANATLPVIEPSRHLYWGNTSGTAGSIGIDGLNGGIGTTLSTFGTSGAVSGTAIDVAAGRFYWVDFHNKVIRWANLDGSAHGTVTTTGAAMATPEGLAINPATHRLYWTDFSSNTIAWANYQLGTAGNLYTSGSSGGATLDAPTSVVVDPAANRIYWTNSGASSGPSYANLDGTGNGHDVTVTGATVNSPVGLAVDASRGIVYWANTGDNRISYAHLDGSGGGDFAVLSFFIGVPMGIAFEAPLHQLFWGNYNSTTLGYLALDAAGTTMTGQGTLGITGTTAADPSFPSFFDAPQATAKPLLTGSGKPGVLLTCGRGTWASDILAESFYDAAKSYGYAWQRNGLAISGATATTYTPSTTGDYTCTVTATNAAGPTTSAPSNVADSLPPTVSGLLAAPAVNGTLGSTVPIRLSWTGADAGSGIAHYEVWQSTNGGSWVKLSSPTSATYTRSLTPSSTTTYRFRVRAYDKAGNVSAFVYTATFHVKLVQQTSTSVHWSGTWTTSSTSSASGGSYRYASAAGASVSYTFAGRAIGVIATEGTGFGSFQVYLDGVSIGTFSDNATSTLWKRIVYSKAWSSSATHTIKLVCLGTAGHPRIDLDAFVVLA